ncbi:hypothetical protein KCU86_g16399, partial [Aureobasidium melanogenum]
MPPILLMKRTLDDLEDLDDFDDFNASEDEKDLVEAQTKRLRDKSPIATNKEPKEKHVQSEEKDIVDRVVELMMPRIEAQMQQLVNGAAMPQQYQFGNRHQSAVQQYHERTQAPPVTALKQDTTNNPSRPDDPLQTFFQEAAQAADTPTIIGPTSNRRVPFMARRHRQMATPGFAPNAQTISNGTADLNPEDDPQFRLQRGVESVMQLWHEFFVGSAVVEIGGDKAETTKKVLKMMDAERVAHNLSLVQYHAWARDKYGYHASSRTHLPKFVADLGEAPEEAIELEARTRSQQDEEDGIVRDHSTDIVTAILEHERESESRSRQGQESSVPPSPASLV